MALKVPTAEDLKRLFVKEEPKPVGATIGGLVGGAVGTSTGAAKSWPQISKALLEYRKSKNAIPMMGVAGKRIIPVALLAAAVGALSGSKLQDLSK